MRKLCVKVLLLYFICLYLMPLIALAEGHNRPPAEPYEKVAAKKGDWYTEHMFYDGKTNLIIGYTGSHANEAEIPELTFTLSETILLTGVWVPYKGINVAEITLTLKDSKGSLYPVFVGNQNITGELIAVGTAMRTEGLIEPERNTHYLFTPEFEYALPRGTYTLYLEGRQLPVDAFLVKGYNYRAYQRYQKDLQEWAMENGKPGDDEKDYVSFGNEDLSASYRRNLDGEDEEREPLVNQDPKEYVAPVFILDGVYMIDEIILSTWNNGLGAVPGVVSILDEAGNELASYNAQGASQGDVANVMWVVMPGVTLSAGAYYIVMDSPEALDYDETGEPVFSVVVSAPVLPPVDFTGTYKINLDLYRKSTLMGPVNETRSSFSLKDHELTVLDKGSVIELISQYQGMPFSQNCEVVERTENSVIAHISFAADLSNLPYRAKIGADAQITLLKTGRNTAEITIEGVGIYERAASAEQGADYNTYDVTASGEMLSRTLPPFVMAALSGAYGVGNIPGPDTPIEAAVGMLFPPLVGVLSHILQEMIRKAEEEKARSRARSRAKSRMRDKNWYKEKYPGLSDEKIATIMMADALGAGGGDPEDAVSIGDNERPGGADYVAPEESAYDGYDEQDYETEEDLTFGKPDLPEEKPVKTSLEQPEKEKAEPEPTEPTEPAEPEYMVVQTTARGGTSLYIKDPKTGEWVNPRTNTVLDIEKYDEWLEQMKRDQEWNDKEFAKISAGESENYKIFRENMEKIKQKRVKDNYENILKRKYGTDNRDEIHRIDEQGNFTGIISEQQKRSAEWAESWRRRDRILGTMEAGAVAVGTAADVGIDGLATITPGGTKIRAGYKVAKGIASTMAEAGAKGKDVVNWGNVTEGAIKGGTDAALDYIPGEGAKTIAKKAAATVIGETLGSTAGASLRGEDAREAFTNGLKAGTYKATVSAITDKVAGELPDPVMTRGPFKVVPTMRNVIVSRTGGAKIGSALADEFGVKPVVMGD